MPLDRTQAKDPVAVLGEVNAKCGGPTAVRRTFSNWFPNSFNPPDDNWLNGLRRGRGGAAIVPIEVEIKIDDNYSSHDRDLFVVILYGQDTMGNSVTWKCGKVLEDVR
jgi:hypothetical protein